MNFIFRAYLVTWHLYHTRELGVTIFLMRAQQIQSLSHTELGPSTYPFIHLPTYPFAGTFDHLSFWQNNLSAMFSVTLASTKAASLCIHVQGKKVFL